VSKALKSNDPIIALGVAPSGAHILVRTVVQWRRLYPGDPWRQEGYFVAVGTGVRLYPEDEGTLWARGHDDATIAQMLLVRSARE